MDLEYAIKKLTHNDKEAKIVFDAMIFLSDERKRKFLEAYYNYQHKQHDDKVEMAQKEEIQRNVFSRTQYYTSMIHAYVEKMKTEGNDNNQIIESLISKGVRTDVVEQYKRREELIEKNRNRKVYLKSKYNNIQK